MTGYAIPSINDLSALNLPGAAAASMAQPFAYSNPTGNAAAYMMPSGADIGSLGTAFDPTALAARSQTWGTNPGAAAGAGGTNWSSWLKDGNNLGAIFQGISALSGAYLGFQQLKQAKEALGFQKEAFRTNLANSTQSYNTSLEDRIRGRSANPNETEVQAYLSKHSLPKRG